jgi:hypothetical protein
LQNVFSAIVTILLCCSGPLSLLKAQGLLLMSLVVIVVNLINLVILEVGEWRGFLSKEDRLFIKENGMDDLMYNGKWDNYTRSIFVCVFINKKWFWAWIFWRL